MVSIAEQIKCVRREIAMRKSAYPKWIASGRMKQDTADREITAMEAVLETLEDWERSLIKSSVSGNEGHKVIVEPFLKDYDR